jgi:hypothetical protein
VRGFVYMVACLLASSAQAANNAPCALANLVGDWEVVTAASGGEPLRLACRLDPRAQWFWLDCRSWPGEVEIYPLEGQVVDHADATFTAHLTEDGRKLRAFARLHSCTTENGVVGDASPWYAFEARTIPFTARRLSGKSTSP